MTDVADSGMISSPLLTDLVRTLNNVPDPAGGLATAIRRLRVSESDLRGALQDMQEAPNQLERQICVARRNTAMRELISALESLHALLVRDAT
ncbi:MAG: hypothetical protein V4617_06250 [Gemmatimonadota bacterium]